MNVGELKDLLNQFTDDTPVILSSDEEGNNFSPLYGGEEHLYDPDATHSPYYIEQVYMTNEELDEILAGPNKSHYSEEDRAPEGSISALVLWPY
jgi:hypothetical protein